MASENMLNSLLAGDVDISDDADDDIFPYQHPLNVSQLPLPDAETITANLLQTCNSDNMNKELQKLANQIDAGEEETPQITSLLMKLMVITTMATSNASSHVDLTTIINKFEQKALNLKKSIEAILQLKQKTMFSLTDEVLCLIGKDETTNEYKELSKTLKERIKPTIKEIKQSFKLNKEEKAFVETTGYFVIQQIVKELYCHFHWIQQTVDDELKHIIQISGKKLQQSGTKEKNIAKRNKITARYLKIVNTVKKTTCNKYWGIFVILFSDIFDQIQYSEANNPKTRYCELWCKNYNMFVQKNTPCWENNNND